jgi:UDP-N-acetyl-2-amino-2-deoxyglucuronate dehydrogenase
LPLRVGFVGCGNITETHARAASEAGLDPVAFHGRDAARARQLARSHGGRSFEDFEEFLSHRPMDLVAIGSPSGRHAEQGIAAAERGLHVLVEKPIDVDTTRADALIAAAERHGVRLGVVFQDRLKPDVVRLRRFLETGGLGRILLASARVKWYRPPEYYSGSTWRGTKELDGGAALVNQGIHTVDLLLWLLGPVARVHAVSATRLHEIEGEDVALALLEFASGAVATLEATTCAFPGYPRRVEISGTEGTVVLEGDRLATVDTRTPHPDLAPVRARDDASARSPIVGDASAHARVFRDFAHAVESGAAPACDGVEGRRSLALVEAVYAAAGRGGREVA